MVSASNAADSCQMSHLHASEMCGKELSTKIYNGTSHQGTWVTLHPWMRGDSAVSTRILSSCYNLDLLIYVIPGMKHIPLKEKQRCGFWLSISHPWLISSCLTMLPSPGDRFGKHNQVKFLKLTISLSSRPGGNILFLTGMIIWLPSLFPPLA